MFSFLCSVMIFIGLIGTVLYFTSLVIVPHEQVQVVERCGKFSRILKAGQHWLIPMFDRIKTVAWSCWSEDSVSHARTRTFKNTNSIPLCMCILDLPPLKVVTQDRMLINIDTVLYYKIQDPVASVYQVTDLLEALQQCIHTSCRNAASKMKLNDIFDSREAVVRLIYDEIKSLTKQWGVEIRLEIQNITGEGLIQITHAKTAIEHEKLKASHEILQMENEQKLQEVKLRTALERERVKMEQELYRLENEQKCKQSKLKFDHDNMLIESSTMIKMSEREGLAKAAFFKELKQSGMSEDFLLQKERVEALRIMASKTNSLVMPWEFFKTLSTHDNIPAIKNS